MSEPKLVTENSYMNRKNRYMAYAGLIMTTIGVAVTIANKVFNLGIEIPTESIEAAVTGAIGAVALVMTIVGYITRPGQGDGVVVEKKP